MKENKDRLYKLLPAIYRKKDLEQGYQLRALLEVIAEQVEVVEKDIEQLYENWFIETCEDWVVPYIGDLIGYQIIHEAGEPETILTPRELQRNKILISRREVGNTVRYRRRKGTLALLEVLSKDVAGWPARAVEFYKLLGLNLDVRHLRMGQGNYPLFIEGIEDNDNWNEKLGKIGSLQGGTVDLRQGDVLDEINGPFDKIAHKPDVRRIDSRHKKGRYNLPNVGVFTWRIRPYSVTKSPACCIEYLSSHHYTFSILGKDCQLFFKPEPESDPTHIAEEMNLPLPIRRRAFEKDIDAFYGPGKSMLIWTQRGKDKPQEMVAAEEIVVGDLSDFGESDFNNDEQTKRVTVDPELGRIIFSSEYPPQGVWVSYFHGFSDDLGGGEYDRPILQPNEFKLYRVGKNEKLKTMSEALNKWIDDNPASAVVVINDSEMYEEEIKVKQKYEDQVEQYRPIEQSRIHLDKNQQLQIRAANRTKPVVRLSNWTTNFQDSLVIEGESGSSFVLDGLMITGSIFRIEGELEEAVIRHSTLVPGNRMELSNTVTRLRIERSILGSINITQDEDLVDPVEILIEDSILDAGHPDNNAICMLIKSKRVAHASLTILRSTVFGRILTHAIELAENSIFSGQIKVARSQIGCMRFCYVSPGSRTPRRYKCQPDLVDVLGENEIEACGGGGGSEAEDPDRVFKINRVRPKFMSTSYGTPDYCRLADNCPEEIRRGADDQSEMGVFHDLYQPQREANLRARLDEYTPAGMEAGAIFGDRRTTLVVTEGEEDERRYFTRHI